MNAAKSCYSSVNGFFVAAFVDFTVAAAGLMATETKLEKHLNKLVQSFLSFSVSSKAFFLFHLLS